MPRPTLKILGSQRDALYEQVRNHLGALNDVWIALECNKDFAAAERLAHRFGEDFRLLEDLGWERTWGKDAVALTMPTGDLRRILKRLQAEAEGGMKEPEEERRAREEEAEATENFLAARDTCRELLDSLDAQAEGQSGACT